MDMRRTCRKERWFFGEGDDTEGTVEWFVAPPGAEFFPGVTPFRSLDWWDGLPPMQERPGPVIREPGSYVKGITPPGYTGKNSGPDSHSCGNASWFVTGIPSPPPPNPHRDANGVPDCCLPIRSATFHLSLECSVSFFSPISPPTIRQVSSQNESGGSIFTHFVTPTEPGNTIIANICGLSLDGSNPVVIMPSPWVFIVSRHEQNLYYSQWFLPDCPVLQDITFSLLGWAPTPGAPHAGAVVYEVKDLLLHGFLDAFSTNLGDNGNFPNTGFAGPLSYVSEVFVASIVIDDAPGFFPAPGPGKDFAGTAGLWRMGSHTQISLGAAYAIDQFGSGNPATYIAGIGAFPAFYQPGVFARFALDSAMGVQFLASYQFHIAGEASTAWSGASLLPGAFAVAGEASTAWSGASLLPGAFAVAGEASTAWSGASLLPGAFAVAGEASTSWSGVALAPGAFAIAGESSTAWSGATSGGGLARVRTAAATGLGATSFTFSYGSATGAANMEVLAISLIRSNGSNPAITPPAGWANRGTARQGTTGTARVWLFTRASGSAQTGSGSFTFSTCDFSVIFAEYSPGTLTWTADQASTGSSINPPTPSGTTGTTTQATELVLTAFGLDSANAATAVSAGTIVGSAAASLNGCFACLVEQFPVATATFGPTLTTDGAKGSGACATTK